MMRDALRDHEQFSAYLDGELDDAERRAFEAELAASDELKGAFDDFQRTVDTLRGLSPKTPPPQFIRMVKQRIRRRMKGRRSVTREWALRLPLEIGFLIVFLGAIVGFYFYALPSPVEAPASTGTPPAAVAPTELSVTLDPTMIQDIGVIVGDDESVQVSLSDDWPGYLILKVPVAKSQDYTTKLTALPGYTVVPIEGVVEGLQRIAIQKTAPPAK